MTEPTDLELWPRITHDDPDAFGMLFDGPVRDVHAWGFAGLDRGQFSPRCASRPSRKLTVIKRAGRADFYDGRLLHYTSS